ncbi:MAG TPA: TM2 domain-containing protein [Gemmataceae bacterium]|jgi:TM2 domain-containing membrane protein YozV|nr:TM2 domain-containing protein [Gemmataceae bacterium]
MSSASAESKRILAGILAIVLPGVGIHKFILGMTTPGIIYLVLLFCTAGLGGITPIVSIIEGIIYLTKSDEEFIRTYQGANPKQWF